MMEILENNVLNNSSLSTLSFYIGKMFELMILASQRYEITLPLCWKLHLQKQSCLKGIHPSSLQL